MLLLRDEVCRSLTGRGLAPGSHLGFKLLDNFLSDDFIDARYLVGAPVLICCFQASITFSWKVALLHNHRPLRHLPESPEPACDSKYVFLCEFSPDFARAYPW